MKSFSSAALIALLALSIGVIGSAPASADGSGTKNIRKTALSTNGYRAAPEFRALRAPRAVVAYDTDLGAYVVLGERNHYYSNGRYFRVRYGAWEVSGDLKRWSPISHARVPFVLRAHTAAKTK